MLKTLPILNPLFSTSIRICHGDPLEFPTNRCSPCPGAVPHRPDHAKFPILSWYDDVELEIFISWEGIMQVFELLLRKTKPDPTAFSAAIGACAKDRKWEFLKIDRTQGPYGPRRIP